MSGYSGGAVAAGGSGLGVGGGEGGTHTQVLSSIVQNTYGAWVTLLTTTKAAIGLRVVVTKIQSYGTNSIWLALRIGIGAGGAETVLFGPIEFVESSITEQWNVVFELPMSIPAGSRISASITNTSIARVDEMFVGASTVV